MTTFKRVFLTVLDSFGIGAARDAADFGDAGADTLGSIYKTGELSIPNLTALGLGNVSGVSYPEKSDTPLAHFGRMREISRGKDTTVGHWELMGILSDSPLPTYPEGFPEELLSEFERRCERGTLCNLPYSGTEVIRDFGEEHIKSGKLIVYTSADSVFQIAAHTDVVPLSELYRYCEIARELLVGKHGVGRVIARPFTTLDGEFKRTADRRDFSLKPPGATALNKIKDAGLQVISVGKISDIFAGEGITESNPTHSNAEGISKTKELLDRDFQGLAFINLVDFDMLYGHRQDARGYARAINEYDRALGEILPRLSEDDLFIITADHGCDPSDDSTDHTREDVPLLVYGKGTGSCDLGIMDGFYHVGELVLSSLGIEKSSASMLWGRIFGK